MDLFSTNVLTRVVNSLQGIGPNSLLNILFPNIQTEVSEEIHFDVQADTMGLAPYVLPTVEGKLMTEQGFTTKTFKPAYIKPKTAFEPGTALKRTLGEALTGSMSPEDRIKARINETLRVHRTLIANQLEVMASSILRTGSVTISGDNYPSTTVSFSRDAALTVTLTSGNKWGDSGVKVLDSLQDWADLVGQKSGSQAMDVVMDIGAWKKFRADSDVKDRINVQRRNSDKPSLGQDAINKPGVTFQGTVDGFNIYTYQGRYKDSSGTSTVILPSGTVLLVGDMLGYQAYGAILDEEAGLQPVPNFSKSWIEKDPGRRYVMTQSAPLLVPYRPNAMLCATVL